MDRTAALTRRGIAVEQRHRLIVLFRRLRLDRLLIILMGQTALRERRDLLRIGFCKRLIVADPQIIRQTRQARIAAGL